MAETKKDEPIQQSVLVDCSLEDAFRLFTERFGEWWPWAEGCEIEPFEGGKVLERTRSGQEHEWGTVLAWYPPYRVEFRWHPCERPDDDQTVEVVFSGEASGTRVTVTHRGWQGAGIEICSLAGSATLRFAEFVFAQLVVV
jgi:hypothetical protein